MLLMLEKQHCSPAESDLARYPDEKIVIAAI